MGSIMIHVSCMKCVNVNMCHYNNFTISCWILNGPVTTNHPEEAISLAYLLNMEPTAILVFL